MDPLSLYFPLDPLPDVNVTIWGWPDAISVFLSVEPLSVVMLPIFPYEFAFTLFLVISKLADVFSSLINLNSLKLLAIFVYTFEKIILPNSNSLTLFLIAFYQTEVNLLILLK